MLVTVNTYNETVTLQDEKGRTMNITCHQGQSESVAATLKAYCNRLNIVDVRSIDLNIKAVSLNIVSMFMP